MKNFYSIQKSRLTELLRQFHGKGIVGQLLRGGIGSLIIKLAVTFIGFALAVILARLLGPKNYGIYSYILALVSIMLIPAQFGLPKLVVRETAKAQAHENWGVMRGIWLWSTYMTMMLSTTFVIFSIAVASNVSERFSELEISTFYWGLALIPFMGLTKLYGAVLMGLRHILLGAIPDRIIRPGTLLVILLIYSTWSGGERLSAERAMSFNVLATGIAFVIGFWFYIQNRPPSVSKNSDLVIEQRAWINAVIPLALTSGFQTINHYTDIIMLGFFETAEMVGVYRVTVQVSILVVFGLQAVSMIVSPYFARFYAQDDMNRLQRIVTVSAQATFLLALFVVLIIAIFGKVLLQKLFGMEYSQAYVPLLILSFGQLINATFGSVGFLLNMTGHERDTARGVAIAALTNIILNIILIPMYGLSGAATATAITLTIWNVLLWRSVHNRLGIECLAFRKITT